MNRAAGAFESKGEDDDVVVRVVPRRHLIRQCVHELFGRERSERPCQLLQLGQPVGGCFSGYVFAYSSADCDSNSKPTKGSSPTTQALWPG